MRAPAWGAGAGSTRLSSRTVIPALASAARISAAA